MNCPVGSTPRPSSDVSPTRDPIWTRPFPAILSPTDDRWEVIHGESHPDCTAAEVDRIVDAVASGRFDAKDYPWLTFLESGQAYTVPLSNGARAVKAMYLHQDDLDGFVPSAAVDLVQELMTHIRGQGDGTAVQNGFDTYRPTMAGNRDGLKTAYTTSFTTANNFLVAPVAHAVRGNVSSYAGTAAEKEAYLEAQRAWLTEFNGLAGDVAGTLVRALLGPDYVDVLDARADLNNPPCPGKTPDLNRFVTSIQVNRSTPTAPVAGTAGGTHRDLHDDPLSFSIAINASVVRPSTQLHFLLFPTLGVAIPVRPGGIALFSGVEFHRAMPMVTAADDSSPIPHGYPVETRLQVIMYPKQGILNGELERSMPTTPVERGDRRHPTAYNLIDHGLVAFGSALVRDLWGCREGLCRLIDYLQLELHLPTPIDALSVADLFPWPHPTPRPPWYRFPHLPTVTARRDRFAATLSEYLATLKQTSDAYGLRPPPTSHLDPTTDAIDGIGRVLQRHPKRPRPTDDSDDQRDQKNQKDQNDDDADDDADDVADDPPTSTEPVQTPSEGRSTRDGLIRYLRTCSRIRHDSLVHHESERASSNPWTPSAVASPPRPGLDVSPTMPLSPTPAWSMVIRSSVSSEPPMDDGRATETTPDAFSILLTSFPAIMSALTTGTFDLEANLRRAVAHTLVRTLDLWTRWSEVRGRLRGPSADDRLDPRDRALVDHLRRALTAEEHRTPMGTGWRYRLPLRLVFAAQEMDLPTDAPSTVELDWDETTPLDAPTLAARLPDILDQVLWVASVEPVLRWVEGRLGSPRRTPVEPVVLSIRRPMSDRRRAGLRQVAALTEVLRAFGEAWDGQTMGLLMTLPLIHLVFRGVAAYANTRQGPKMIIDTLAEVLTDPALEFRARLDACARSWRAVERRRLSPRRWVRLVERTGNQMTLESPSVADNATVALVDQMRAIMEAGAWHLAHPPDRRHEDAAVQAYVDEHLRGRTVLEQDKHQPFRRFGPSFRMAHAVHAEGTVRLRLTRWIAARCFGWGRATLPPILTIPDLATLWTHQEGASFWSAQVYGQLLWPRTERDAVRARLGGLIDHLLDRLGLERDEPPVRPVPFAAVLVLFERPGSRRPRVPRLPTNGLLPWLIACDLSVLFPRHVAPPEVGDLARKILAAAREGGGGGGPWKAFRLLDPTWVRPRLPSETEVVERLQDLRRRLVASSSRLFHLFDPARPSEMAWIDVEHVLCKVTRNRAAARRVRPRRGG